MKAIVSIELSEDVLYTVCKAYNVKSEEELRTTLKSLFSENVHEEDLEESKLKIEFID